MANPAQQIGCFCESPQTIFKFECRNCGAQLHILCFLRIDHPTKKYKKRFTSMQKPNFTLLDVLDGIVMLI